MQSRSSAGEKKKIRAAVGCKYFFGCMWSRGFLAARLIYGHTPQNNKIGFILSVSSET